MAAPSYSRPNESPDIVKKRALLYSARIRHGSETQPIREAAIDRLVQQLLLTGDNESGLTVADLHQQDGKLLPLANFRISRSDLQGSMDRLISGQRVTAVEMIHPKAYRLVTSVKAELAQIQVDAEQRLEKIVKTLFKSGIGGWRSYEMPFLRCLSTIFTSLSEKYVGSLTGEVSKAAFFQQLSLEYVIREAKAAYPEIDESSLRAGMSAFLMEDSPDYSALKWNTAQNYYVAKALGLDPSGSLLSREVFGNAEFYLDTNVVISALEPVETHHRTFESLGKACKSLGAKLNVCQISLDELRNVVEANKDMLRRVGDVIPEALAPKVTSIFFELYKKNQGSRDLENLFHNFSHPIPSLRDSYGVELVDSEWFVAEALSKTTSSLAETLRAGRVRRKTESASRHDALLVRWVEAERSRSQSKVWIVTRDRALPSLRCMKGDPIAITLDALLQWIAPITSEAYSDSDFLEMFSESIRLQLLPPENFFDLRDFCLLAEFGVSCNDLPVQDVEACIRELKTAVPGIDPTEPRDREKISHQISKFFADPGRKFKEDLRTSENLREREKGNLLDQLQEKDRFLLEKTRLIEAKDQLIEKGRADIRTKEELLAKRHVELARFKLRSLRWSARLRLSGVLLIYALVQVSVVREALLRGGNSWLSKASVALPVLGIVSYGCRLFAKTLIGERAAALGHWTRQFLGVVSEAPLCSECGGLMTRNGSCYKCENCGGTSGCS